MTDDDATVPLHSGGCPRSEDTSYTCTCGLDALLALRDEARKITERWYVRYYHPEFAEAVEATRA